MPRLRILAGPSPDQLSPISANDGAAHEVKSDAFEGKIAVFLKYEDESDLPEYFDAPERAGVTWSIQVQGRFLQARPASSVLFGNTFDRPLQLPWGTNAVLKFMHFVDPTLEQDLAGEKPWALSPFVCTMPHLKHDHLETSSKLSSWPTFPPISPLGEDCESLGAPAEAAKRRAFFARQDVATTLGPDDLLTADFCYGFLSFPSLTLKLPGGLSFDCTKYWDGQPVRFVCCERPPDSEGSMSGHGRTFWCVSFELDDASDSEDEDED
ncbi:DUF1769-domain-containing protein, partial [Auricularia subglabra TFB-10046 SS5]